VAQVEDIKEEREDGLNQRRQCLTVGIEQRQSKKVEERLR